MAGKEVISLPLMGRDAEVRAASFREDDNTVEVVWTTGASVRRYSWRDGVYYDEKLEVSAEAVRLDRLNRGAPFLDTHDSWSLGSVIGSVVPGSARIKGGEGVARIKLSEAPEHAGIVANIRAGVIRNVSVGYSIHRVEKTERGEGEVAEWRVVDWEPMELSAVPIPADAGASIRSEGGKPEDKSSRMFPCTFIRSGGEPEASNETPTPEAGDAANTEETAMTDRTNTTGSERGADDIETRAAPAPAVTEADARRAAQDAVQAERKRVADIQTLARKFKKDDLADAAIASGKSLEEFRNELVDELAKDQEQAETRSGAGVDIRVQGAVAKEKRGEAISNALLHRYSPGEFKLDDTAREFRGMSLLELARDCLESEGIRTRGMSRNEVAERALAAATRSGGLHSTSDFPIVLANVANKTLRRAYEAAPQTFRPLVRVTTLVDFKAIDRVQLGEAPQFEKVNEAGEFKRGSIGEGKESYKLATYGKVVGITRQVIINDDLDAFTRLPAMFGVQYANLESDIVWAQLVGNPTMGDGTTLFHADHGNLAASGAAIDATTVAAGFAGMRLQKGLDGKTLLNIMPSFLLGPVALQMKISQFLTSITPAQTGNVVPEYLRGLTPITEPRLDGGFVNPLTGQTVSGSGTAWYLASGPGMIDTIELAYLEGQQGVYTETRTGFDVDGVEVKVRADVAAKAIDWKGFWKNAGA